MDPQTSFIPKKSLISRDIQRRPVNLFFVISLIVFLLALLSWGGAVFYRGFMRQQIEDLNAALRLERDAFDPQVIGGMKNLDLKIEAVKRLISGHTVLSPLFSTLEQSTNQKVRFKDFGYALAPTGEITLKMRGEAVSYAAVALQQETFRANPKLKNVTFSDFSLDTAGNVLFNVSAVVDPSLVAYISSSQ